MSELSVTPPAHDIQQIGTLLGSLLSVAAITRLVVVDDSYATSNGDGIEMIVRVAQTSPAAFAELIPALESLEADELEHISSLIRTTFDTNPALKIKALDICRKVDSEDAMQDSMPMSMLEQLIKAIPTTCSVISSQLSSSSWQNQADSILGQDTGGALVLIDRDFKREDQSEDHGLTLLASLLKDSEPNIYGALLTHTVKPCDELEQWTALANQHSIPQHRFVVISKERLSAEKPDLPGFLHLMRLAILCGPLQELREKIFTHFSNAINMTNDDLNAWSVFDFDEAVFGSSRKEGIWEGETLLRVMTTFTIRAARTGILGDIKVRDLIGLARQASSIQIPFNVKHPWSSVGRMALAYQQAELYFNAEEYANRHHLPLEAGDVFSRITTGGNAKKEEYILLAQPCDLMVRGKTQTSPPGRAYDASYSRLAPLCVISDKASGSPGQAYELPYWHEDGRSAFVNFARIEMVRTAILDLCVLHANGSAIFETPHVLPSDLSEQWREHMERLLGELTKEYQQASELLDLLKNSKINIKQNLLNFANKRLLPKCSNTGHFNSTILSNGFSVNLHRIRRVNSAMAADILRAFARHQSRTAFDQPVVTKDLWRQISSHPPTPTEAL